MQEVLPLDQYWEVMRFEIGVMNSIAEIFPRLGHTNCLRCCYRHQHFSLQLSDVFFDTQGVGAHIHGRQQDIDNGRVNVISRVFLVVMK